MRDTSSVSNENQARSGPGFNRRDFLKGSSVAVAATAIATGAEDSIAQDKKAANVVAAKPAPVKLNINGKTQTVTVEPRVTLIDVLRNDLNLTGAKEVCTTTNCGSCTVIIDGKPVYSCARTAVECQGKKITTVEGLGDGKNVDEVVKCFVKHDATQCGFCTPGFVVATRAFLNTKPNASLDEMRKGLGGNICRCGTYDGVAHAALECAAGKKGGK
ncbi:MAG TPA: (2Fe-2S)-binding protein [Planctomycetaceae bacterium]|nr:(2Fe-2S)-binding protein [Planctomycetaceae bacterium]